MLLEIKGEMMLKIFFVFKKKIKTKQKKNPTKVSKVHSTFAC